MQSLVIGPSRSARGQFFDYTLSRKSFPLFMHEKRGSGITPVTGLCIIQKLLLLRLEGQNPNKLLIGKFHCKYKAWHRHGVGYQLWVNKTIKQKIVLCQACRRAELGINCFNSGILALAWSGFVTKIKALCLPALSAWPEGAGEATKFDFSGLNENLVRKSGSLGANQMVVFLPAPAARIGACPCPMAGAAMLRGSLSARPLALQASGLAFGHPFAALGQCQA